MLNKTIGSILVLKFSAHMAKNKNKTQTAESLSLSSVAQIRNCRETVVIFAKLHFSPCKSKYATTGTSVCRQFITISAFIIKAELSVTNVSVKAKAFAAILHFSLIEVSSYEDVLLVALYWCTVC